MTEEYKDVSDPFRKWGLLILGGIVILCLLALVVVFLARNQLATTFIGVLASDTPVVSPTFTEMVTSTLLPTETSTIPPPVMDTILPTPNRTPPMEVMTQINGPPLLDEEFSDNSKNWTGLDQNAEFLIQESRLELQSTEAELPAVLYCAGLCGPYIDNYYVQAELVEDRASEFTTGLVFGLDPAVNTYYNFSTRPSSSGFALRKFNNGAWETLVDWTPSQQIYPYPQPNIIGASVQNDVIQLYINGTRVGNYTQSDLNASGRIGVFVERDGTRLISNEVLVYQLVPFSLASPTSQMPPAGTPSPGTPSPGVPSPTMKYTLTPTAPGSCPRDVPSGTWVVVLTKSSEGRDSIKINGVDHKVDMGVNVFYLQLDTSYVINIKGKTYEFIVPTCKIVYLKMK